MTSAKSTNHADLDGIVETACGAQIMITSDTPHILFNGEVIYFCGEGCLQRYNEDPLSSCLASRLLSGD